MPNNFQIEEDFLEEVVHFKSGAKILVTVRQLEAPIRGASYACFLNNGEQASTTRTTKKEAMNDAIKLANAQAALIAAEESFKQAPPTLSQKLRAKTWGKYGR